MRQTATELPLQNAKQFLFNPAHVYLSVTLVTTILQTAKPLSHAQFGSWRKIPITLKTHFADQSVYSPVLIQSLKIWDAGR